MLRSHVISDKSKGMLLILLSAFCYSLMTVLLKYVNGVSSIQKCFVRNAVTCVIAVVIMTREKNVWNNVTVRNGLYLFLRALFGTSSMVLYYYAVDRMMVANITILSMTAPFFCVIISAIILHEKVKPYHIFALLMAFAGILLVAKPGNASESAIPILAALFNAVFSAMGLVMTRILGKHHVDSGLVLLVSSVVGIVATVVLNGKQQFAIGMKDLMILVLSGVIGGIGNYCVTRAYGYAPAKEISIFDYSQIVFSMLLGLWLFSEMPDSLSIAGYLMVTSAAVYMFQKTRKSAAGAVS